VQPSGSAHMREPHCSGTATSTACERVERLGTDRALRVIVMTFHRRARMSLAVGVVVGFASSTPARAEPDNAWVAHMDALALSIATLLPELDANAPQSDESDEHIRAELKVLSSLAHSVSMVNASRRPDADPTIPLLARELDRTFADATHARRDHLRDDAAVAVAACFACHTRSSIGAARPRTQLPALDEKLSPFVKADVLAATRRFDDAAAAYDAVIRNEDLAERDPVLWERAVKRALALTVRTQQDPRAARAIVDVVISSPAGAPMWSDAAQWKRDIAAWMNEKPASRDRTAEALDAQAERLMSQAELRALTPSDASADILYLRATATLHEALAKGVPADMKPQALASLGIAYEALRDIDIWAIYLAYDEACIESAPHSKLAGECYTRLERGTYIERRGNSGAPFDDDDQKRLARLRDLSR
jgi:hypothetical protein